MALFGRKRLRNHIQECKCSRGHPSAHLCGTSKKKQLKQLWHEGDQKWGLSTTCQQQESMSRVMCDSVRHKTFRKHVVGTKPKESQIERVGRAKRNTSDTNWMPLRYSSSAQLVEFVHNEDKTCLAPQTTPLIKTPATGTPLLGTFTQAPGL